MAWAAAARASARRVAVGATLGLVASSVMVGTAAGGVPDGPQTSCRSVVQIGDSLSVGLDDASHIADADARISARYAAVGVRTLRLESSGGRSVVEHLDSQAAGEAVARKLRRDGFHGCWVIALGTNDAANVDAGSAHGYSARIDRMMAVIGDDPVLWVDVKTLKTRGHYASEHMRMFNQALAKAHARYPALQVFAWSDVVADDWFQPDGIHYTAAGDTFRAALIPAALAAAFPA
jgi:lysophospholipase L1-like esterase